MMRSMKVLAFLMVAFLVSCDAQSQSGGAKTEKTVETQTKYERLPAPAFSEKMNGTADAQVVDVRTPGEFSGGFIAGAVNVDYNGSSFSKEIDKLDKEKPVFVYCHSGGRSAAAVDVMKQKGFKNIYELQGGISGWKAQGLALQQP